MNSLLRGVALAAVALVPLAAHAQPPDSAVDAGMTSRPVLLEAHLGPAWLINSKSKALGHLFKPQLQLHGRWLWRPRLALGGALVALLDENQHYRILGGVATARYGFWETSGFSLGGTAGIGVGNGADILHSDLRGGGINLYALAAVDGRWRIGQTWALGPSASVLNLADVQLAFMVSAQL